MEKNNLSTSYILICKLVFREINISKINFNYTSGVVVDDIISGSCYESHENDPSRKMYHPSKNGKCTTHKFKEICFRKIFHPSKKMVNYPLLKSENDPSLTILMYVM